jgi:hypothetical protein
MIDQILKEEQVLETTSTRLDEFIHLSQHALNELYDQRSMLKVMFTFNLLENQTTINGCCEYIGIKYICHSIH